jgi:FkbM family methyltransferase
MSTIAATFSQNGEDLKIAEYTASIKNGKFLDIGGGDGITFSNSKALVDRGWSGVIVEPGIDSFRKLMELHGGNEKVTLVHAAVGADKQLARFWDCGDMYSTTEAGNFAKWKEYCKKQGIPFKAPYWTPQISIVDLLAQFNGPYDVMSVDTEGTSVSIFSRAMQSMWALPPRVIVVEHDGLQQACMAVVGARYEVVDHNAENLVLVRRDNRQ